MKSLQVALANLRDVTKPLDAADRVILIDHIALLEFFAPDRNAIIEECIAAIDSVDYEFDDPLEAATTKIRALKLPPKPERAK